MPTTWDVIVPQEPLDSQDRLKLLLDDRVAMPNYLRLLYSCFTGEILMKIPKMTSEVAVAEIRDLAGSEEIFGQPKNFWEKIAEEIIENGMKQVRIMKGKTDVVKIARP